MFPFPIIRGADAATRNAQRDERVLGQVDQAIGALESMLSELRVLRAGIQSDPEWTKRQREGAGYHRSEWVGRQFDAAGHGLRRFYEASVLATTTAGGYEDEPAEVEIPLGPWPADDDEQALFEDWKAEAFAGDTALSFREWVTNHRANNQEV